MTDTIARGTAAEIKSYVDRIERIEEERKGLGSDVRDIYTEAKGRGYNPKALRKVITQRRQKTDEEVEAEIDRYRIALGMPGATYRSVAEQFDIPRSTLHRLVPNTSRGTCPSVEMTAEDLGVAEHVPEMSEGDLGDWRWVDKAKRADAAFAEKVRTIAAGIRQTARHDTAPGDGERDGLANGRADNDAIPDPGPMPEFLRRLRA